jgi:hypothetical protein
MAYTAVDESFLQLRHLILFAATKKVSPHICTGIKFVAEIRNSVSDTLVVWAGREDHTQSHFQGLVIFIRHHHVVLQFVIEGLMKYS